MTLRKSLFWVHLAVGLAAGVVIAVMCLTGAALAFEKRLVAWAERDVRQVAPPAPGARRLSLEELRADFRQTRPGQYPSSITVSADPRDAVVFAIGRDDLCYVNPHTGEARQPASTHTRDFMRVMTDWHRALALSGASRATGRAITGACNFAFLFLAVSGFFLWWPRKWRTKGLRRSLWFLPGATGRARDWNRHNVIGFWFLPVLVVLAGSGLVLSYKWANDLVYRAAGEPPPGAGPRVSAAVRLRVPPPASGATPLDGDALLAAVRKISPQWKTITLLLDSAPPGNPRPHPLPVDLVIQEQAAWPRPATLSLSLDPFTGHVLWREGSADLGPGRQARIWVRYLHTGEALGSGGQFVAGLACLGGCFLVYTGFALAWRRFFDPNHKKTPQTTVEPT